MEVHGGAFSGQTRFLCPHVLVYSYEHVSERLFLHFMLSQWSSDDQEQPPTKSINSLSFSRSPVSSEESTETSPAKREQTHMSAFRRSSMERWEAAKVLRNDPSLQALDEEVQKTSPPGSKGQGHFRQFSKQAWRTQRELLLEQAAQIGIEDENGPQVTQSAGGKQEQLAFRKRLVDFYTKYNPEKLDTVDRTLDSFAGREEELFAKLHEKYVILAAQTTLQARKKHALLTNSSHPTVFMDIAISGKAVGRIVMRLLNDQVPLAAENFRCLCTGEKVRLHVR